MVKDRSKDRSDDLGARLSKFCRLPSTSFVTSGHERITVAVSTSTTIYPRLSNAPKSFAISSIFGGAFIQSCTPWSLPVASRISIAARPQIEDAKRFDRVYSYASLCRELQSVDRYHGLNLTNLAKQDRMTVEWRIHGGTTEWEKIKAWVLATQTVDGSTP